MNTTEDDSTALIKAAEEGDPGLVNMLLDKGADVNAITGTVQKALIMALKKVTLK